MPTEPDPTETDVGAWPTNPDERAELLAELDRAAEKEAARSADRRAVESGAKSAEQVNRENSLAHGLSDRFKMSKQLGIESHGPAPFDDGTLAEIGRRIAEADADPSIMIEVDIDDYLARWERRSPMKK